jgi:hypothetical protein
MTTELRDSKTFFRVDIEFSPRLPELMPSAFQDSAWEDQANAS